MTLAWRRRLGPMATKVTGPKVRLRFTGMRKILGAGHSGHCRERKTPRLPDGWPNQAESIQSLSPDTQNAPFGALCESGGEGGIRTPEAL
jgi:hypothetical protein